MTQEILSRQALQLKEAEPRQRHLHFTVIGGVGVGKSELVRFMSQDFGLSVAEESYQENPFLSNFYLTNPSVYAFDTQEFFLSVDCVKRKKLGKQREEEPVVEDQGIEGDVVIEHVQRQMGWINDPDHQTYLRSLRKVKEDELPKPDIFVGLVTDPETAIERIKRRGRPMELAMLERHPEYFRRVTLAFNKYIGLLERRNKVIVIDTGRDFVKNFRERYRVLREIATWTTYYVGSPNQMNGRSPQGEELLIPKYLQLG